MASTYSTNLKLELIGTGDQSGTWGATTNTNMGTLIEQAIAGYATQAVTDSGVATVLTIPDGASSTGRNYVITLTGALTAARTVEVPAVNKPYIFFNSTTGGFAVTVKVTGQTGVVIANGKKAIVYTNTTDVIEVANAPATEAGTQTLTNKTLTAPVIATIVNTGTLTLPTSTDTLVGRATTDTLTNKTLTSPLIGTVIGGTTAASSLTLQSTSGVGTTDSILFKVGNNGATTAMTVDTSGNVGIGTSSPAAKLDIGSGNLNFSSTAQRITGDMSSATLGNRLGFQSSVTNGNTNFYVIPNGSATTAGVTYFNSSSISNSSYGGISITSTVTSFNSGQLGTGSFLPITFSTSGTEAMRIDTSGNVGIGTASPSNKLTVAGNIQVTGNYAVYVPSNSVGGNGIVFGADTNASSRYWKILDNTTAYGLLDFQVSASNSDASYTSKMVIDSSGNVGIGVSTTYGSKVFVLGSTNIGVAVSDGTNTIAMYGNGGTAVALGTANSVPLFFATGSTERMRIDSSGNVGIGTTTGTYQLQVFGAGQETPNLTDAGLKGGSLYLQAGAVGAGSGGAVLFGTNAGNGTPFAAIKGYLDNGTTNTVGSLCFSTRSAIGDTALTERIRIDSSGNVGIGTASPSTYGKLGVVSGSTYFGVAYDTYTSAIIGPRPANDGVVSFILDYAAVGVGNSFWKLDANSSNFQIYQNANARLTIDSSGNVGIGTVSPNASAILDAQSTTKGVRFPNMTTTQKNAVSSPAAGLVVFDTTLAKLCVYSGSAWQTITSI